MKTSFYLIAGLLVLIGLENAQPALLARVVQAETEVYEGPTLSSKVVERLPQNQLIAVSNVPTRGFYKVRTPQKQIGWVVDQALDFKNVQSVGKDLMPPDSGPIPVTEELTL